MEANPREKYACILICTFFYFKKFSKNLKKHHFVCGISFGIFAYFSSIYGTTSFDLILPVSPPINVKGKYTNRQSIMIKRTVVNGSAAVDPYPQARLFKKAHTMKSIIYWMEWIITNKIHLQGITQHLSANWMPNAFHPWIYRIWLRKSRWTSLSAHKSRLQAFLLSLCDRNIDREPRKLSNWKPRIMEKNIRSHL